jgi:hypothetical protein
MVLVAGIAAGVVLAGCTQEVPRAQAPARAPAVTGPTQTLFEIKTATIDPGANIIWRLAGKLRDDDGNLDAGRLTNPEWTQISALAAVLRVAATTLAQTSSLKVVHMGGKIQGEGTAGAATAADVQRAILADPKGFSELATKLAAAADAIAVAAGRRDAAKAYEAQARMKEVCSECHAAYWRPQQAGQQSGP